MEKTEEEIIKQERSQFARLGGLSKNQKMTLEERKEHGKKMREARREKEQQVQETS